MMTQQAPRSVAIVAMGSSFRTYIQAVVNSGSRHRVADEVWAVNSIGAAVKHDRMFLMDDIEKKLRPLARARPDTMPGGLFEWLATHPGPIYTPVAYPEFPGTVAYPLEDVLNGVGIPYLNTTVAYALAYAIHLDVKHIGLYGCDFTYPDRHVAESGRACVEFLLGIAGSQGRQLVIASDSTLFDACVPREKRFYGYADDVHVALDKSEPQRLRVTFGDNGQSEPRTDEPAVESPRAGKEPVHESEAVDDNGWPDGCVPEGLCGRPPRRVGAGADQD
jgi:hypothetical protein